jgi:hypothetical protein
MADLSLVLKCAECDWVWTGKKRKDPTTPDPKELRSCEAASRQHESETGHHAFTVGLCESQTFEFGPEDAPDFNELVALSERSGAGAMARFQRLDAQSKRRKAYTARKRSPTK